MMERADLMAAQRRQTDIENRGLLAKQARATEFQNELGKLSSEGFSARGLNELMIKYPEAAEQLKAQYANLSTQEKQSRIDNMMPIVAAVNAGDNASAQIEIQRQIDAFTSSGKTQEAEAAQRMSELLFQNPNAARTIMNTSIAAAMGPDKFDQVFGKLEDQKREEQLQPGKIAKAVAEGKIAEVKAQYQEQLEKAEIALKGAQTTSAKAAAGASYASSKKTLAEIDRIREMTPAERDRVVAQTEKLRAEARAKSGEAGAQGTIEAGQRVLDTVARIKELGSKPAFGGGLIGKAAEKTGFAANVFDQIAGPAAGRSPTFSTQAQDVESLIETLKAQQFLTQIKQMQGMGALSNSEGEKLTASVANLSLTQSPQQLQKNIQYIEDTTKKGMEKAQRMMGGAGGGAGAAPPSNIFDAANAILGEE
jgi:serine protease inhibitor ecotin